MDQDATWTMVGLGPGNIVLDGDPNFRLMSVVATGQTAGWIKMPLDTKVGLGPGHIVLHGNPTPPKWGTVPQF